MATFSAYSDVTDVLTFSNIAGQVETGSLVGGNSTIASPGVSAGAQSVPAVSGAASGFSGTFMLWILDGPNSEAIAGCTVSTNTITVPSPGVTYAHAAGVSISSAGTAGCLASMIARASREIETICKQGGDGATDRQLFAKSRTEMLSGPNSFRAAFDNEHGLRLRPYHFPITAVASLTVQFGAQSASSIDLTYQEIPDGARSLYIPLARTTGTAPIAFYPYGVWPRNLRFVATLSYTGGPISGSTTDSVPFDIKDALYLLLLDQVGRRENPQGAASVRRGDFQFEARLRGDKSGRSLNRTEAEDKLAQYTAMW